MRCFQLLELAEVCTESPESEDLPYLQDGVCSDNHYVNLAFFPYGELEARGCAKSNPEMLFHFQGFRIQCFSFSPSCMNEKSGLLTTWPGLCMLNPTENTGYVCSELRGRKKSKLLSYPGSSEPLLLCPDIFISEKECYAFSMSSDKAKNVIFESMQWDMQFLEQFT